MYYFVEMVQMNRVVKLITQSRVYEVADTAFQKAKRQTCREARMLKYVSPEQPRVLLKSIEHGARKLNKYSL